MKTNWIWKLAGGVGLLLAGASVAVWRWKQNRLDELEAGSELVTTDRGVIEVAQQGLGYPVLVLHGDPGGYDQGINVADSLFNGGFKFIAPSRPGFLRTPLDDTQSPSDQAGLLVALLNELHIEQALVVGVSGGGPHALQLAAEYPERVSGLVLVSAVTTEIDDQTADTGNPVITSILTSTLFLDVRSGLFALLYRFVPDRLITLAHRMMSTLGGEELDKYVEYIRTTPNHRKRSLDAILTLLPASVRIDGTLNDEPWLQELPLVNYETVECPVLVLHGEFDAAVSISHAEAVAETLTDVEFVRLDADHLVWIGPDAERASRTVEKFAESVVSIVGSTN